jgi:hypothetical protein
MVAIASAFVLLIIGGTLSGSSASKQRDRLDRVRAQHRTQLQAQADERDRRTAEIAAADPEALLAEVAARNEDFARAVTDWDDHGRPASGISAIQQAQSTCLSAIVAYDVVAARYADLLPSGLPEQIDLDQESLNCSAEAFRVGGLLV